MSTPEKRYLVSIGSFMSEKSAIDRLEAARKSGFSGEIVDDANNPTVNIVAAIMCIGQAIAKLTEQVSAISEKIEAKQAEPAQTEPEQEEPRNEKLKAFGAKLESKRKTLGLSRAEVASKTGACVLSCAKKRNKDYKQGFDAGVHEGVKTAVRLLLMQFAMYLGDKRGWKRERIFEAILWIKKHAEMIQEDYTSYEETVEDVANDYGIIYEDGDFILLTDEELEERIKK